jgi:transposase
VVEVNRPDRRQPRSLGKSDPLDASAAAEAVLSGRARVVPKAGDGITESIRALHLVRAGAVKSRTACINQMRALLVTAPSRLREQLAAGRAATMAAARAHLETGDDLSDPPAGTTAALPHLARRYQALDTEIADLDRQLAHLVKQARPDLLALKGVGTQIAAQLLITCGDNPDRLTTQAAFAWLCGVSPVPASSGKTRRHRLNRGGDRQANRALHPDRPVPHHSRSPHPRLPATPHPPRPHQMRNPAMPQALHRPRALQHSDPTTNVGHPAKRSTSSRLTNIGASHTPPLHDRIATAESDK